METNTNDKKEEDFPEAVKLDSGNSVKSDSNENKPCPHCGVKSTIPGVNYLSCSQKDVVKRYMSDLGKKSVAVQAEKYGKRKFAEMGKRSGISKRKKIREKLKAIGETVEGLTLK